MSTRRFRARPSSVVFYFGCQAPVTLSGAADTTAVQATTATLAIDARRFTCV
jgi:hypothetical protein